MATRSVSKIKSVASRLDTHEAVCAERYIGLMSRLGRLEKLLIGATVTLIGGLFIVTWAFVSHGLLK